jgi:Short C-terminal domain
VQGRFISVDSLPKAQARRLYALSQEMEEAARTERRARELEDKRAAAGGVVVQSPSAPAQAPAAPDPLATLQKLKGMLDAGLISQAEYDQKKSEILAAM